MDIKALDKALQKIIEKRNALKKIDYNDPVYDDLEEVLHDLEDAFQAEFGSYLEKVLKEVHDAHCPDTDVLHPISYIAKSYTINGNNEFQIGHSDGIYVEMEKYPNRETKLALLPNPLRVVLNIGSEKQEILWEAK